MGIIARLIVYGLFWGLLALFILSPSAMYAGIIEIEYGELILKDKIIRWIPILNISEAEKTYTGRTSWIGISSIALIVTFLIRYVTFRFLQGIPFVQGFTMLLLFIALLACYISNVRLVFMILNDNEVRSIIWRILVAIAYPYGQYYIGAFLSVILKNMEREEETFK